MNTLDILRDLVAFPTVSRSSNLALIDYVRGLLEPLGATCRVVEAAHDRTNLWVTIGPADRPGVILSGHSDVVPVAGQDWSREPFQLTEEGGRHFGRGTADMKGFLASAVGCAMAATSRQLATPLHLAISCDEEIGCVGIRPLLEDLQQLPVKPLLCWIGEPTSMQLAIGHKGKVALGATCIGREVHSALAPAGLNAIHLAADFIAGLRRLQADLADRGRADNDYDVPYSTVHVGVIAGGEALNIVPARCTLEFEIRSIAEDDTAEILAEIRLIAEGIAAPLKSRYPEAEIRIEQRNAYPGLNTDHGGAIAFMTGLTGANNARTKVAFGTEGGLFSEQLEIPTVVLGPGSMDQGHKPDEFVSGEQLAQCDLVLSRLLDRLVGGVTL